MDNYYWVDLTPEQARLYRQMEKELLDLLGGQVHPVIVLHAGRH